MSWVSALQTIFKVKKLYDTAKKVKKVHDYGEKIGKKKPEELTWDDLKYFNNKQMDEAKKNVSESLAAANKALSASLVWPSSSSTRIFGEALKLSAKKGADSPEVKKKLDAYRAELAAFDQSLTALKTELEALSAEFAEKIATAGALREYARVLEKAFMQCAKVPSLAGTAQNAMFFTLSQDASQLAGSAGSLETALGKLKDKNADYVRDVKAKIAENKGWIDWAKSPSPQKDGNLKANQKASKPKK